MVGGRLSATGARLPLETPVAQVTLEGSLTGWEHARKLVRSETGHIQHLRGTGLDVGEAVTFP
jgi:hypothetical protein